ncbi:hypothetical protein T439DRAFT_303996, partial [Meredithblackwellia eburnea MCA 4105]
MLPAQKHKVDISKLSPEELKIFQKYGKAPTGAKLSKVQDRKYFDSGDWALSKAGHQHPAKVGTVVPSPADIPHASPPQNPTTITGTSPTNNVQLSPGKEPIGTSQSSETSARED